MMPLSEKLRVTLEFEISPACFTQADDGAEFSAVVITAPERIVEFETAGWPFTVAGPKP
jgi:hypothetical protein